MLSIKPAGALLALLRDLPSSMYRQIGWLVPFIRASIRLDAATSPVSGNAESPTCLTARSMRLRIAASAKATSLTSCLISCVERFAGQCSRAKCINSLREVVGGTPLLHVSPLAPLEKVARKRDATGCRLGPAPSQYQAVVARCRACAIFTTIADGGRQ